MKEKDYTKILLDNQKSYLEAQAKNIEVLTQMKDTLINLNDCNVLHGHKTDAMSSSIEKLAISVEARAKVMNTIFILLAIAIVILAGAEKALQYIRP